MTSKVANDAMVGRGNQAGAELFRQWFSGLNRTAETGGQAAYVFVMGSFNEILKVFDLPVVFPEINSLQTAVGSGESATAEQTATVCAPARRTASMLPVVMPPMVT